MESICKTVIQDDQTIKFPRLSLEELFGICEEITAERMKEAEQLGKADGLPKIDISNIKLDLKLKKVTIQELLALTNVPQVASKVIRASLAKAKIADQSSIISKLQTIDAVNLASSLVLDEQDEPVPVKDEVKVEHPLPLSGSSPSDVAVTVVTQPAGAYGE